jgi:hypothetical protein
VNLPVLNIPAEYADGAYSLHRQSDGSSVLVLRHLQYPRAVYFDERSAIWRELVKHPSEISDAG